jgi:hypothetical protein
MEVRALEFVVVEQVNMIVFHDFDVVSKMFFCKVVLVIKGKRATERVLVSMAIGILRPTAHIALMVCVILFLKTLIDLPINTIISILQVCLVALVPLFALAVQEPINVEDMEHVLMAH